MLKGDVTISVGILEHIIENANTSVLRGWISKLEGEIIRQRGYKDGRGAGTWVFDGNMADEHVEAVKTGIKEGNPFIMDQLPGPRLSGEFADDPTWESILSDELNRPTSDDGDIVLEGVYCDAFSSGVEDEVLKWGEHGLGVDVGRSNSDLVIEKYAHRTGERLVKIICPGSAHDGRLVREVYDHTTGSYKDHPIPRPR